MIYKTGSGQQSKLFTRTLTVNGKRCRGLLDTGATRTLIITDIVAATRPSHTVLKAYDGTAVATFGVADVTISSGNKSCTCTCLVVPTGQTVLFGQDVIVQLQLLSLANVNVVKVRPVDITVHPKATPVALPSRRHAFSLREAIEAEIKRLEERDVIESVQEATQWVSPLVPTRKGNGTLRLWVDYRRLNKAIIRERHMLPTLEEITAKLEAKVFSVLDAESGFHQIPLAMDSRPYTTFTSHCGLYRFKRLPFGISSAPEIFQRVVSDILHSTEGVMVYRQHSRIRHVSGRARQEDGIGIAALEQRQFEAQLGKVPASTDSSQISGPLANWARNRTKRRQVEGHSGYVLFHISHRFATFPWPSHIPRHIYSPPLTNHRWFTSNCQAGAIWGQCGLEEHLRRSKEGYCNSLAKARIFPTLQLGPNGY